MSKTRIEVSTFEPHSSNVVAAALLIGERMNAHVSLTCLVVNCPYIPLVQNKTPVTFQNRVSMSK